jgi:hypothetical protein
MVETADVALNSIDVSKEPETFEETYCHPNLKQRNKFKKEILKEFQEMRAKDVHEKIHVFDLPNGCPSIKISRGS